VVTIAILCIMAGLAIPGLHAFAGRKAISHQADELDAVLHRARERAMGQGIHWRIVFRPGEGQWFSFGDVNRNGIRDPGEQQDGPHTLGQGIRFGCTVPSGPNGTVIPADGISFVDDRVNFSPMGACNAGTVYLSSREGAIALRVFPASGSVLVYAYSRVWRVLR
jgi:type II secretory pathway pseudopilin PulG